MAIRNYRQAKRNREETRKKKQQEKLQRKLNRGATSDAAPEPPAGDVNTDPKTSP
jgi:hypothetical protein